jgi:hypothetical protein
MRRKSVPHTSAQQIGQTLESWVSAEWSIRQPYLNIDQVYNSFKLQAYALILLRGVGHP